MDTVANPTTIAIRLRRITWEATGVVSLDFATTNGADLPPFEAGAHVDLHLPDGTVRQYSLCGDPADRAHYRIGVREIAGGRVSRQLHQELRPGAMVNVGLPRNNFPLVPASAYLFVAGGIGITPLLPMMRQANAQGTPWTLLYCVRTLDGAPFLAEALALGGIVEVFVSAEGARLDIASRLTAVQTDTALYCCGPATLMEAVERATVAWPEGCVRFEWFAARPTTDRAAGGFEIVCAQSGLTLNVPEDRSVLQVLTDAGICVPCSCEQGVCGTCEVRIVEGEADHRDSILSASERAANQSMMVCVSRAKSLRLVLDV